jgi:hypothetical protein
MIEMPEWIGAAADVSSLAALPVSVYAAWKIRGITRRIAFAARADSILTDLEADATYLEELLPEFVKHRRQADLKLKQCIAAIQRTSASASTDARRIGKRLSKLEADYDQLRASADIGQSPEAENLMRQMLEQIRVYSLEMRNIVADRRLGANHDA